MTFTGSSHDRSGHRPPGSVVCQEKTHGVCSCLSRCAGHRGRSVAPCWIGDSRAECGRGTATAELAPAAADEVSALTATQFNFHAAMYQAVGAQAIAMNEAFVAMLGASADSYAATEAANIIAVS